MRNADVKAYKMPVVCTTERRLRTRWISRATRVDAPAARYDRNSFELVHTRVLHRLAERCWRRSQWLQERASGTCSRGLLRRGETDAQQVTVPPLAQASVGLDVSPAEAEARLLRVAGEEERAVR